MRPMVHSSPADSYEFIECDKILLSDVDIFPVAVTLPVSFRCVWVLMCLIGAMAAYVSVLKRRIEGAGRSWDGSQGVSAASEAEETSRQTNRWAAGAR